MTILPDIGGVLEMARVTEAILPERLKKFGAINSKKGNF